MAGLATGGNIAIDTATGGLTGLTQKAPQLEKPKNKKATTSPQGDKK